MLTLYTKRGANWWPWRKWMDLTCRIEMKRLPSGWIKLLVIIYATRLHDIGYTQYLKIPNLYSISAKVNSTDIEHFYLLIFRQLSQARIFC